LMLQLGKLVDMQYIIRAHIITPYIPYAFYTQLFKIFFWDGTHDKRTSTVHKSDFMFSGTCS